MNLHAPSRKSRWSHLAAVAALLFLIFPIHTQAQTPCLAPLAKDVTRGCVVEPNLLWRGAKPSVQAATSLVRQGVASIVNLELLNDDLPTFNSIELPLEINANIVYARIRDWEPWIAMEPQKVDNNVVSFLAYVNTLPAPIYVHCRSGQNRTGIMVAAYRIMRGDELEAVIADMKAYKGIWFKHAERYIRSFSARKELMAVRVAQRTAQIKEKSLRLHGKIVCTKGACEAKLQ